MMKDNMSWIPETSIRLNITFGCEYVISAISSSGTKLYEVSENCKRGFLRP